MNKEAAEKRCPRKKAVTSLLPNNYFTFLILSPWIITLFLDFIV